MAPESQTAGTDRTYRTASTDRGRGNAAAPSTGTLTRILVAAGRTAGMYFAATSFTSLRQRALRGRSGPLLYRGSKGPEEAS
jgi:hypothetical protein